MKLSLSIWALGLTMMLVGGGKQEGKADVGFQDTGYPVVKERIELNGIVVAPGFYGDFNEMEYFKKLTEKTNISVKFKVVPLESGPEVINLMFASQDFPDFALLSALNDTTKQVQDAISAGSLVQLDDYVEKYSPRWREFFAQNSYAKKSSVMGDGKLWGLPMVRDEPSNSGIRDQWMINVQWLNELGLSMPKTTDDFYRVLKAFKENAGKGTIPENVIPWYLRFDAAYNGGQFELYNAFGVFTPGYNGYFAIDKNGKVVNQAINPKLKAAIKFLHKLYSEGLIPAEGFTGAETFESIVTSKTPITGSYLKYFNHDTTAKIYQPMPPLSSPANATPMYRRQVNSYRRNAFIIFSNNKHPKATFRFFAEIADPEWSVQAMYGLFGEWLEKKGDQFIQKPFTGNEVYQNVPGNHVPFIIDPVVADRIVYSGSQADRSAAVKNIYGPFVVPAERYIPAGLLWTPTQIDTRRDLETEITNYISSSLSRWIVDGGIDEGWEQYLSQLKRLGLPQLTEVYQQAVDSFNQN